MAFTKVDCGSWVDGDSGATATASKIVKTAMQGFGATHALVNNAGICIAKPFMEKL